VGTLLLRWFPPFFAQLLEVVAAGAPHVTRVMLDNMTRLDPSCPGGVDVSLLKQAVALVGGKVATEGSGNVTLQTVAAIASSGVDFISVGALTHSVKALDISLNIVAK
jgi:nicotinate-nucleotide pyrophosphorylase (carboxylating)